MNWFGKSYNQPSEEDIRQAKRDKLEADRQQRALKRAQHREQLQRAAQAQEEADQARAGLDTL